MAGVNRLREVRESKGMSQRGVAGLLGLSSATVNRHEQMNRGLTKEVAEKYAEIYGVSVVELYTSMIVVTEKDEKCEALIGK